MKPLGELTVSEYMTEQVISVDDTAKLTEAIRLMDQKGLSVMPVVDSQNCIVGILSNRDLMQMIGEVQSDLSALHCVNEQTRDFLVQMLVDQGDNARVCDVMTAPVETVKPEANLVYAAQRLCNLDYHHLPVADPENKPVGIISSSDFVRAIAEHGAAVAG